MARREFLGSVVETTTTGSLTSTDTSISLTDGSTFPSGSTSPFVIVIDRGTTSEEKVLITSRSSNTLTVSQRGYDGTTATTHTSGAKVDHVLDATSIQDMNTSINDLTDVITADTSNSRVGIGTASPSEALDVIGNIEVSGEISGGSTSFPTSLDSNQLAAIEALETKVGIDGSTDTSSLDWRVLAAAPVGTVMMSAAATTPDGWLLCDGSAVSRTTYADLFTALGTNFGTGDGSTTFNLPNMNGNVARGTNGTPTSGGTGGANSVTLNEAQTGLKTHDHYSSNAGTVHGLSSTSHDHSINTSHDHEWPVGTVYVTGTDSYFHTGSYYAIYSAAGNSAYRSIGRMSRTLYSLIPTGNYTYGPSGMSTTTGITDVDNHYHNGVYTSTTSTSVSQAVEVLDPFLQLRYIIKT